MTENLNEEHDIKKIINLCNENNYLFDNYEKNKSLSNREKKEKSNSGKY